MIVLLSRLPSRELMQKRSAGLTRPVCDPPVASNAHANPTQATTPHYLIIGSLKKKDT